MWMVCQCWKIIHISEFGWDMPVFLLHTVFKNGWNNPNLDVLVSPIFGWLCTCISPIIGCIVTTIIWLIVNVLFTSSKCSGKCLKVANTASIYYIQRTQSNTIILSLKTVVYSYSSYKTCCLEKYGRLFKRVFWRYYTGIHGRNERSKALTPLFEALPLDWETTPPYLAPPIPAIGEPHPSFAYALQDLEHLRA